MVYHVAPRRTLLCTDFFPTVQILFVVISSSHLCRAHDGISCNWEACRSLPRFAKITEFLAHAKTEHKYDIKIKLCHLPAIPQFNHSDGFSRDASTESETRQGTETPASSLDFDIAKIDPRLMEPRPITALTSSISPPSTGVSVSPNECSVTSTDPFTRRVTRGATKAASLESGSKLESSPQHAAPSSLSRKRACSEEQPMQKERGTWRSGKMTASTIKPSPRRSKRLRAQ